jgi:hypothetical protein
MSSRQSRGGTIGVTSDSGGLYEWSCPVCDASNVAFTRHADASSHALTALQSHVRVTDDPGHGERHEIPDCLPREVLAAHVESPSE